MEQNNKTGKSYLDSLLATPNKTSILISIDDDISQAWNDDSLGKFTEPEKNFHYIEELQREVNNGGFNQYFINGSGNYAHETLIALKEIGATNTYSMLQTAINEFPDQTVPKDWEKRGKLVAQIEEKANLTWHKLDEEFYSMTPVTDSLDDLCIAYIIRHQKDFER